MKEEIKILRPNPSQDQYIAVQLNHIGEPT